MIVKLADFYYDTTMSVARVILFIENLLKDHIQDSEELDLEHFLDSVEENEDFEACPEANDCELEYTLDKLGQMIEDLQEEMDDVDDEQEEYPDNEHESE